MERTCSSEHHVGLGPYSCLRWILLLLVLLTAGLQGTALASEEEPNDHDEDQRDDDGDLNRGGGWISFPPTSGLGGPEIHIAGPDYVTVGVPCSFQCVADCPSPSCTYSMALDGQGSQGQGNVLAFTPLQWAETLALTCTAQDDHTGATGTATKTLQVLAGPVNVTISGPDVMNPGVSHSYSCRAHCRPGCTYSWLLDRKGPWLGGQGNVIAVVPRQGAAEGEEEASSKTIMCKATNSVSGLFVTSLRDVDVTSGPSSVRIDGPDSVSVARASTFTCAAECRPSCRYSWTMDGYTVKGSRIDVLVEHHHHVASFALRCHAQNTVSKKATEITKHVVVGDKGAAVRAQQPTAFFVLPLCALIIHATIAP